MVQMGLVVVAFVMGTLGEVDGTNRVGSDGHGYIRGKWYR